MFSVGDKVITTTGLNSAIVGTVARITEHGSMYISIGDNHEILVTVETCKRWTPRIDTTFETIGHAIGKLVAEKNAAYGSSYAKTAAIVRLLYPDGIKLDQIDGLLFILRILDKLGRISQDAHSLNEDAYRDIAGYGILAVATNEAAK